MKSSLKPKAIPHNNKQNISLIISFETRVETLLRGTILHCKQVLHYFLRSVQFYQQSPMIKAGTQQEFVLTCKNANYSCQYSRTEI